MVRASYLISSPNAMNPGKIGEVLADYERYGGYTVEGLMCLDFNGVSWGFCDEQCVDFGGEWLEYYVESFLEAVLCLVETGYAAVKEMENSDRVIQFIRGDENDVYASIVLSNSCQSRKTCSSQVNINGYGEWRDVKIHLDEFAKEIYMMAIRFCEEVSSLDPGYSVNSYIVNIKNICCRVSELDCIKGTMKP